MDKLICDMPVKSSGGVKTWLMTLKQNNIQYHLHICIDMHAHMHNYFEESSHLPYTAGRKHNHIQCCVQVQALTTNPREDCDCAFGVSLSPFFRKWVFFSLLSYLKLDSLLINHNYFANDVHGNALWCLWDGASNSRSRELIQTCHREETLSSISCPW